jgi:hypothetical protein
VCAINRLLKQRVAKKRKVLANDKGFSVGKTRRGWMIKIAEHTHVAFATRFNGVDGQTI